MTKNVAFLLFILAALGSHWGADAVWRHRHAARVWRRVDGSAAAEHNCYDTRWFSQRLDHFSRHKEEDQARWLQRYIVCDKYWDSDNSGPIFFYAGNEADVDLYVNATGLIWENAEEFGALIVFAEHRYYGASQPFGRDSWAVNPSYLTTGQALADYATLLFHLKGSLPGAHDSPVIVFGGSYGGELATWMRLKYPHLVMGSIAASAPIGGFPGDPAFKPSVFWEIVTRDASPAAGAPALCVNNTRAAFRVVMSMVDAPEGRVAAQRLLKLCKPLKTGDDVVALAYWLQGAFDAYAMGNFPYASSYINGDPEHPLPPWPMRAACRHMTKTTKLYPTDMLEALHSAVNYMYNASGAMTCHNIDPAGPAAGSTGPWDFQFCTEQMAQEEPYFPANGVTDMFWDQGLFNWTSITQHCSDTWGVVPEAHWALAEYGGLAVTSQLSNVVFSNGLLDPWSAFGVMEDVSDTVVAVVIPDGAHHIDLMFSHPEDSPTIKAARLVELTHMRRWVEEHRRKLQARNVKGHQEQAREESESKAQLSDAARGATRGGLAGILRKGRAGAAA